MSVTRTVRIFFCMAAGFAVIEVVLLVSAYRHAQPGAGYDMLEAIAELFVAFVFGIVGSVCSAVAIFSAPASSYWPKWLFFVIWAAFTLCITGISLLPLPKDTNGAASTSTASKSVLFPEDESGEVRVSDTFSRPIRLFDSDTFSCPKE